MDRLQDLIQRSRPINRLGVVLAGYSVIVVFALSFVLVYSINLWALETRKWPSFSVPEVLLIAALLASPLAIAFLWERLGKVQIAGIEISLAEIARPISDRLAKEVRDARPSRVDYAETSAAEPIQQRIQAAIDDETAEFIAVDLGAGELWWSSRLYLLARLAQDYTAVRRIVFVAEGNGIPTSFVGMASPTAVGRCLAEHFPKLESAYLRSRDGTLDHGSIESLVGRFLDKLPGKSSETVSATQLERWLGNGLEKQSISWIGQSTPEKGLSLLIAYFIVDLDAELVPLVDQNRQVTKVADRIKLASQVARVGLREQLEAQLPGEIIDSARVLLVTTPQDKQRR